MEKNHSHHHDLHKEETHTHDKHAGHHTSDFKKKFIISLFLTLPLVVLSAAIQDIFNYQLVFPGTDIVQLLLASVLYFYCGLPFLKGAVSEVRDHAIGMMSLISVAISVAYFYSVATVFGFHGMDFFWELGTLISIMLLGHWLEMRSIMGASKALSALAELIPKKAIKLVGEKQIEVSINEIQPGDKLLVRANDKIPTDGIIRSGETHIDESMLTGESRPVKRVISDPVIGGSINGNGTITIQVTGVGDESYLQTVIDIVQNAQNAKSRTQNLADRAAKWLTYISLGAGFLTLVVWLVLGRELSFAIMMMVGVMVIACPHALGLAIPLVASNSISKVASNGVLIRNRTAFENSGKLTTVVFDKTGTLTVGNFTVVRVLSLVENYSKEDVLRRVTSLEQFSEHPIASAITNYGKMHEVEKHDVSHFESLTAKGVKGVIEGEGNAVLSPKALADFNLSPKEQEETAARTVVYLVISSELVGQVELADEVRQESKQAVKALKDNHIKVFMATGDNALVAKQVSDELQLDGFFAELKPEEKLQILTDLQAKGEYVAMVGDGVNDAPALATANVGVAIGSGTEVANEAADIILIQNNPEDVSKVILWGKLTKRKMMQNLAWATLYNVIAIPVAAGVLYPFILPPAISAAIMSLSTIIVAINAQLLLKEIK
ncbi:copper-transporting ATPase CopB [Listeria fleischmannii 1991]|uniref:P-type Cu(+) transporter n=2 Tax=Listeria fleischmannii TaxID=1069827 RepID=A0A2X3GIR7_9LIST|nr:heavy metal translocating P-type ATPase [Listeria fleischmannii]EMG27232.1 copper-translocating p-type atpase [Listeria fleischmannii subsp. fleischmannii LU2006-1]KMT61083.1 copper-transporting ATPase CopB [Listeria fleischmannii 1991]SQC68272.1 Copper-exporting P-type ATPase B [Listeria fleischmannii subsp. fleischmannii]